jgi:hypothetical protein
MMKLTAKHSKESAKIPQKRAMYRDTRQPFVLELDDETDEDVMAALMERDAPMVHNCAIIR